MNPQLTSLWTTKSDRDLVEAADLLWEFTPEAQAVIVAEMRRRGLHHDLAARDVFPTDGDRPVRLIDIGQASSDARWVAAATIVMAFAGLVLGAASVALLIEGRLPGGFVAACLAVAFFTLRRGFSRHARWAPYVAACLGLAAMVALTVAPDYRPGAVGYVAAALVVTILLLVPAHRAWRYRKSFRGRLAPSLVRPRQARMFQTWGNWRSAAPFLIAMPVIPGLLFAIDSVFGFGFHYPRILMLAWPILFLAARKRSTIIAPQLLTYASEPPIIYLRSFADDEMGVAQRFGMRVSIEEALTCAFAYLGPVIAIGRPGEAARPVGAAREYVSNEEWQDRVASYIGKAQLIVLLAGTTEGLRWEMQRISDLETLHKLVLVLPPGRRRAVAERWIRTVRENPAFAGLNPEVVTERALMVRLAANGEILVAVGNGSGIADYFEAARALAIADEAVASEEE